MSALRIAAIGLVLFVGQLSGCGGDEGPTGPPVAASVEVTPTSKTLTALGDTCRFTAVAKAANGATISGQTFTWTSSAAEVASVEEPTGLARAEGNGTATITATTAGVTGSAAVMVGQLPATLEVTPALDTLTALGDSLLLSAVAEDANGYPIAGASFDWSSSDNSVATVVAGLAVAMGLGEATITVVTGGVTGSAVLTVEVFASVSAGASHTCGLTNAGVAYCWGDNQFGQLGERPTTERLGPVPVSGGLRFASLSAGYQHTCGVTTGGAAYCWGHNEFGGIGDGTTTDRFTPVQVSGGLNFLSLSAGGGHTCGVTTGAGSYCWGQNEFGGLGDGTTTDRFTPVQVSGGLSFAFLSAGEWHTCGVTTGGVAYCWGRNQFGGLGDGTTTDRFTPMAVSGGLRFTALSAASMHTCGVTTGGVAYCWGDNEFGSLGDGTAIDTDTPVAVSGGLSFAGLSAGMGMHTCGVTTGGAAYCWGSNGNGELGDGTTTERHTPVQVSGGLSFASLSRGPIHTCGVTTGGAAYCWGLNSNGQLGEGTTTDRVTPVRVEW